MDILVQSIPDRSDLEIILVDDHSTLEWNPKPSLHATLVHIKNESNNRYAGAARNTGLKYARGNLVLFADSDDFFSDTIQDILNEALETQDQWECFMFKMGTHSPDAQADRHSYRNSLLEKTPKEGPKALIKYHSPAGRILKKDFLNKNGIDFSETQWGNDFIFSVKIALALDYSRLMISDKTGYIIRSSENSTINQVNYNSLLCRMKLAAEANTLIQHSAKHLPLFYMDDIIMKRMPNSFTKAIKASNSLKATEGALYRHPRLWLARYIKQNIKKRIG